MNTEIIQKELISGLVFPTEEVLPEKQFIKNRNNALAWAMLVGNSLKHKVKIYFKDLYKERIVETTVWFANESHAVLKGGIIIPARRIVKIEF